MIQWEEIDRYAQSLMKEAGKRIRETFTKELQVETKSNKNDLVTNVDKETEAFFIEGIQNRFPDHKILGEEGQGDKIESADGVIWVIDPIDGTMNFVHQQRNFAISIGIYHNHIGMLGYIYDVVHDELFTAFKGKGAYFNEVRLHPLTKGKLAEAIIGINATWVTENRRINTNVLAPLVKEARGTRSFGSAALEMAYVACGWLDGYISMRLSPWDFAGGKIIVEEVGGKATKLTGTPLSILEKGSVLFARPGVHEEIIEKYVKKGNYQE